MQDYSELSPRTLRLPRGPPRTAHRLMSYGTYMSRIIHVTYLWVLLYTRNAAQCLWGGGLHVQLTTWWVMSRKCHSLILLHIYESCHTWVMFHTAFAAGDSRTAPTWCVMSHVCHAWFMSHIYESCLTRVMWHTVFAAGASTYGSPPDETCHTYVTHYWCHMYVTP